LWTRRAVGDLIRKEFGIDLAERTVGQYLRRWGYTSKKPSRHARQQDPDVGGRVRMRVRGHEVLRVLAG
jgi:transposase